MCATNGKGNGSCRARKEEEKCRSRSLLSFRCFFSLLCFPLVGPSRRSQEQNDPHSSINCVSAADFREAAYCHKFVCCAYVFFRRPPFWVTGFCTMPRRLNIVCFSSDLRAVILVRTEDSPQFWTTFGALGGAGCSRKWRINTLGKGVQKKKRK